MIRFRLRDRLRMWLLERVMDLTWRHRPDFYQRVGARLFALAKSIGADCVARGGHRAHDIPDRWNGGGRRRYCRDCGLTLKDTDPVTSLEIDFDMTDARTTHKGK